MRISVYTGVLGLEISPFLSSDEPVDVGWIHYEWVPFDDDLLVEPILAQVTNCLRKANVALPAGVPACIREDFQAWLVCDHHFAD